MLEQQRHPSAGRQNEGIEGSAEERMILLDMGGLPPREKWEAYWPSYKEQDVAFGIPILACEEQVTCKF